MSKMMIRVSSLLRPFYLRKQYGPYDPVHNVPFARLPRFAVVHLWRLDPLCFYVPTSPLFCFLPFCSSPRIDSRAFFHFCRLVWISNLLPWTPLFLSCVLEDFSPSPWSPVYSPPVMYSRLPLTPFPLSPPLPLSFVLKSSPCNPPYLVFFVPPVPYFFPLSFVCCVVFLTDQQHRRSLFPDVSVRSFWPVFVYLFSLPHFHFIFWYRPFFSRCSRFGRSPFESLSVFSPPRCDQRPARDSSVTFPPIFSLRPLILVRIPPWTLFGHPLALRRVHLFLVLFVLSLSFSTSKCLALLVYLKTSTSFALPASVYFSHAKSSRRSISCMIHIQWFLLV